MTLSSKEMSSVVQHVVSDHTINSVTNDPSLNPQPVEDVSATQEVSNSSTDSAVDIPTPSPGNVVITIDGYDPAEARPNDHYTYASKEHISSNSSTTTLEMSVVVQHVASANDPSRCLKPADNVSVSVLQEGSNSSIDSVNAITMPSPDSRVITIDDFDLAEARPVDQKLHASKELSTVTKLLFTVSIAAILLNASDNNNAKEINPRVACVEKTVHLLAIILMIVGLYIRVERPNTSKWLQRMGHLTCLITLMLIRTPLLELPHALFWFPTLLILAILTIAIYCSP